MQHRPRRLVGAQTQRPLSAEIPCFWLVISHAAANHVGNGVRVRWKIVPDVTDV